MRRLFGALESVFEHFWVTFLAVFVQFFPLWGAVLFVSKQSEPPNTLTATPVPYDFLPLVPGVMMCIVDILSLDVDNDNESDVDHIDKIKIDNEIPPTSCFTSC